MLRTTLAILSMPPLYEVLFLFSAPRGYLVEIKRLDQPADAPKSRVFQWLWIDAATVTTLQFVDMTISTRQYRTFKEAQLWFDDAQGELCWNIGPTELLVVQTSKTLTRSQQSLVNLHLD
ncbi:MAG: hypothetical protein Q7R66_13015 [Undibacterium sp.]|uniref:hypothetical protein n=1 Tax=Undibacterium sp. TaxID=1914977 RepID=UPI00271E127E|nr:hypothetical protein [Undibacterium sp.]MDO8653098.1 hypothetical protein [Undibacterium sp.]